jgi:3-hydroxyisobutyrate dehydrogenase-like beta-hydroxyacid dehydrogenase
VIRSKRKDGAMLSEKMGEIKRRMMMKNVNIGFIGLGNMGNPMARLLVQHGYRVYGHDIDPNAIRTFACFGGIPAPLTELFENVNIIILMLPNSQVVNQVIEEIISCLGNELTDRNFTIIDMSSSYPLETQRNAHKLAQLGIAFLDAPVSGGVKKAATGELTIMVGGNREVFDKHRELFAVLGKQVFYVGPSGSGHLVKMLNNFLSAAHLLATCEAVHTLSAFGVDPQTGICIFNHSTGSSISTKYKFPEFILPQTFASGFSLGLLAKDVSMTKQLLRDRGIDTPLSNLLSEIYGGAACALGKEADHTEIFRFVAKFFDEERKNSNM